MSTGEEFVVTREFDAPRDLVWKAWTEVERLKQWWGPKGFTMLSCTNDLRPGGAFHYGMRAPDGGVMWGKWVYREVVSPERLVFLSSFSNEKGEVTRAPFSADWPLQVFSTLELAERRGRTTVTMRGVPHEATEAERKTFASFFGSMQQGWGGTLDQLGEFLARA
ncbi:MAG TPA: SRPBCC domain-containing protein [Thermoanaerobaculia bacterium]|nr:SRPBCC domain-containing protein [Thermoanaerobaculia bacterium]